MATKEALQNNSFSKEERQRIGTLKSDQGYNFGRFGIARFGHASGYELDKEALNSNSFSKEGLS